MSNLTDLNTLVDLLKALSRSLEAIDQSIRESNFESLALALDALILRTLRVEAAISGNHQMDFPGQDLLALFSKDFRAGERTTELSPLLLAQLLTKKSPKQLGEFVSSIHKILDKPTDSLRKFALSEILRSSINE